MIFFYFLFLFLGLGIFWITFKIPYYFLLLCATFCYFVLLCAFVYVFKGKMFSGGYVPYSAIHISATGKWNKKNLEQHNGLTCRKRESQGFDTEFVISADESVTDSNYTQAFVISTTNFARRKALSVDNMLSRAGITNQLDEMNDALQCKLLASHQAQRAKGYHPEATPAMVQVPKIEDYKNAVIGERFSRIHAHYCNGHAQLTPQVAELGNYVMSLKDVKGNVQPAHQDAVFKAIESLYAGAGIALTAEVEPHCFTYEDWCRHWTQQQAMSYQRYEPPALCWTQPKIEEVQ